MRRALATGLFGGVVGASPALAQPYRFPATVEQASAWYPTAYKDQGGTTDWACSDITYSGHRGSDFGVGSWSGMDAGRTIVAAAGGVVTETNDGEYDRCSSGDCAGGGGYGNYVKIAHPDGTTTIYAHMKNGSVAVGAGQAVACGDRLGEVGSSGYSTGPHLHFEVRDPAGNRVDPFAGPCSPDANRWVDPGSHGGLPALVCADAPECAPEAALRCGTPVSGRNDADDPVSRHAWYGCTEYVYSGPERILHFRTWADEPVTLRLDGLGADLDLFLLETVACDGTGCVAASISPDGEAESLSFTAVAGRDYTVVIDGWEGAVSDYTLVAECSGGTAPDTGPDDTGAPDGGGSDGGGSGGGSADGGGSGGGSDGAGTDTASEPRGGRKAPLPALCAAAPGGWPAPVLGALVALVARRRRPLPRGR